MVAVVADDLTGAAELGGIGLRHGLTVEIGMEAPASSSADLLIIAANTRSLDEPSAVAAIAGITGQLAALKPEWIYKKTDSVLRGHVVAELNAQLNVLGLERALLVPANPALGRTIKDGHYFLQGKPVHQSAFALDPEFSIRSSSIKDMLHTDLPVMVRKHREGVGKARITVGEVSDRDDLRSWAALTVGGILPAGAAGFFTELLEARRAGGTPAATGKADAGPAEAERTPAGYPALFVSGTTFGRNREIIRTISDAGGPVIYMDAGSTDNGDAHLDSIINYLLDQGKAILAIEGTSSAQPGEAARQLRERMAALTGRILAAVDVEELVIEGGATAYAILEQAGLRHFFPKEELAPGVIRMAVAGKEGLHVTVKPGSYEWPETLQHQLEN